MATVSRIQHNIPAMNSFTNYTNNTKALTKNIQKLSSGYRINSAADDAAGLAISEKMRSQIKGLEKAQDNANDGISLIQTAEGALTEVNSMLTRLTELATQSANGVYENAVDRENIQAEAEALLSEIDRISQSTNFNGINLLDGSMSSSKSTLIDVSELKAGDQISFGGETYTYAPTAKPNATNLTGMTIQTETKPSNTTDATNKTIKGVYFASIAENAKITGSGKVEFTIGSQTYAIEVNGTMNADDIGKALANKIGSSLVYNSVAYTASYEADSNKLRFTAATPIASTDNATKGLSKAGSNKLEAKTTTYSAGSVIGTNQFKDAADLISKLKKVGFSSVAGTIEKSIKKIDNNRIQITGDSLTLQVGDTNDSFQKVNVDIGDMSSSGLGLTGLDLSTQDAAGDAIATIKAAVNKVSSQRGDLGALQNRLDYTLNNLAATTENITASESQIRDVDMAKEMTQYSKNNILVQAAQSMLAQANSLPQGVLQLLQ